ncbi:MAG: hypothetical protein QM820_47050 [Minicystis sp.]
MSKTTKAPKTPTPTPVRKILLEMILLPPQQLGFTTDEEKFAWIRKQLDARSAAQAKKRAEAAAKTAAKKTAKRKPPAKTK